MAIVSVAMPNRENNALENLLTTMKLIQGGFGIKTDIEQNKLLETKAKSDAIDLEKKQAEAARRSTGKFNQEEFQKQIRHDEAGNLLSNKSPGALYGWYDEAIMDPKNPTMFLRDENGRVKTKPKGYWYRDPSYAINQQEQIKAAASAKEYSRMLARGHGYYTMDDLMDPKVVYNYSFEPQKSWRKRSYIHPDGLQRDVYIQTPEDVAFQLRSDEQKRLADQFKDSSALRAQELKNSSVRNQIAQEQLKNAKENKGLKPKSFEIQAAEENASALGLPLTKNNILNSRSDVIDKKVDEISKRVEKANIADSVNNLEKINDVISGGLDGDGPIPGVGTTKGIVAGILPYGTGDWLRDKKEGEINSYVTSLQNSLVNIRTGQASSEKEFQRIASEIGTSKGSSSRALRIGLRKARDAIKRQLEVIQSGYQEPSLRTYMSQEGAIHSKLPIFNGGKRFQNPINQSPIIPLAPKQTLSPSKPNDRNQTDEEAVDSLLK